MLRSVALALAVVLLCITVGRASWAWSRDANLGYAEGIWLGLAVDASNGVLYRPLDGPQGIGGTRYFPFFYLTVAAGIAAGLSPIASGYLVATASVCLLLGAVIIFLRRRGRDPALALAAAAALLACQPAQMAVLATRGDALAAGLAILGLALSIGSSRSSSGHWAAPVLFALAVATKPTSLYAPIAAVIALMQQSQAGESRRLAIRTIACIMVVLAALMLASGGRMFGVLLDSSSGGAGLDTLLAAPMSAARILRRVPESAGFIAAALLISAWAMSRRRLSLEHVALFVCLAATVAIYASPATVENHLIDLTAIAIVVIAAWTPARPQWAALPFALILLGGGLAGASAIWRSRTEPAGDRRAERHEVLAALADVKGPILFDQPMMDAQQGTAPYVVDQYVYTVRLKRDPSAVALLVAPIDEKKFGAIVFDVLAVDALIAEVYPGESGRQFKAALDRAYRLDRIVAGKPIYTRR